MDMHNRDNNPIRQLKKIKKISMAYSIIDESVTNIKLLVTKDCDKKLI